MSGWGFYCPERNTAACDFRQAWTKQLCAVLPHPSYLCSIFKIQFNMRTFDLLETLESLLIAQSTLKFLCWTSELGILYVIGVVGMMIAWATYSAPAVCQAAGGVRVQSIEAFYPRWSSHFLGHSCRRFSRLPEITQLRSYRFEASTWDTKTQAVSSKS